MKRHIQKLFAWGLVVAGTLGFTARVNAAPMPTYKGAYAVNLSSLESPSVGAPAVAVYYGRLEFTISSSSDTAGSMTGTLRTKAGKSYPVKSALVIASNGDAIASDKQGQNNVGASPIRGTSIFAVNFSLRVAPDGKVSLTGLNGAPGDANATFFAEGALKFLTFTGKPDSRPAWLGTYTMAMISPEPSGATVPAGAGYASLVVANNGRLSFKGKLGDGSPITGSASPAANGVYSLFVTPSGYAAGGYFTTEIDIDTRGLQAQAAVWNKVAKSADKAYPAGFSTSVDVIVQPWLVPAKKAYPIAASLGFGSSKNFTVDYSDEGLSDGKYSATLPDTVRLTGLGKLQAVAGGVGAPAENNNKEWDKVWNVTLNPLTGVFSGKMLLKHVDGSKTVVRNVPVEGVFVLPVSLSEEVPFAYGQYVVKPKAASSTIVSGLVTFVGPLEDNTAVATAGSYRLVVDHILLSDSANSRNPGAIAGTPADGATVAFIVAEDLQTLKFGGRTLKLQGGLAPGSIVFTNASPSNTSNTLTVTLYRSTFSGAIIGVAGMYTKISISGFTPRIQTLTFQHQSPLEANLEKL